MKRKPVRNEPAANEADARPEVVPPQILAGAKRMLGPERGRTAKCVVCSAETTASADQLCWVCRRLKISAWREVEQQMPAQE